MSAYNPPSEPLSTFNSGVFTETSGTSSLTRDQADQLYLQYPIGQGQETLPALSTTGQVNVGTALSVGTTSQFTGDITLNGTSTQTISCSAPTALNIRTTTNSVPINFNCQSSAGTYTEVLKVVADNTPRIITKAADLRFTDNTTTSYQSSIINLLGTATFRNMSSAGTGSITLDASTSTAGAGSITLTTKNGSPSTTTGLILTGTALTATTAGASVPNLYLCVTINGTLYKIALLSV